MLVTRGLGTASIITSGYGTAGDYFVKIKREVIRLYSAFAKTIRLISGL